MPRLGLLKAASTPPGSAAPLEMSERRDSTKNAEGIGPGRWSVGWTLRTDPFRWKCGAMKNRWRYDQRRDGDDSRPLRNRRKARRGRYGRGVQGPRRTA